MNCSLCGTPVKEVGHTTKHYDPLEPGEYKRALRDAQDKTEALQAELDRYKKDSSRSLNLMAITNEGLHAEAARLREALTYVAKFEGHHYAPLRACGEDAVAALRPMQMHSESGENP